MAVFAGPDALRIGEWVANPADDTLTRGNEKIKLEPRMMRMLMRLAQTPGTVVSQDQLLESVWTGLVVSPASVYQSVSQLRKVFGDIDAAPTYIETVARKGYRLIAPVSPFELPPAAPAPAGAPVSLEPARRHAWVLPTAIATIAAAILASFSFRGGGTPPSPSSIVVLPIVDMTADRNEQPMCDGLTEELSNSLAQVPTLRVVSRTSAYAYRNDPMDVREIGRRLGATHVLEGSLRRSNGVTRVTVQLIAAREGFQLWSTTYDIDETNVLRLQERVARDVVGSLRIQFTAATAEHVADRVSRDPAAYRQYLVARHHAHAGSKEGNDRAMELYREALKLDPDFVLAQVELAYSLINQRYYDSRDIREIAAEAEPLLERAAALAPQMADVYVARGALHTELRRRGPALRDLEHALVLNPNSRNAASELGFYHLTAGEPRDALAYYTTAAELDPLDYNLHTQRCTALADLAMFAEAEAACERARTLEPESPWSYSVSGTMEAARGNIAAALRYAEAAAMRANDVAAYHADRARWLLELGLAREASGIYTRLLAANPQGARQSFALLTVAMEAARSTEGAAGLRRFVASEKLDASDNHRILFELANSMLSIGDNAAARRYTELALAAPSLEPEDLASPWLARTGKSYLLIIAATLRANGDDAAARTRFAELDALLARLESAGIRRHAVFMLGAQLAAMRGDGDGAMSALRRAAEFGWRDERAAESEPYFESLRQRPDYRALMDQLRARNAADAALVGAPGDHAPSGKAGGA